MTVPSASEFDPASAAVDNAAAEHDDAAEDVHHAEDGHGAEGVSAVDAAADDIGWPDFEAESGTRELLERLDVPAAALGRLQELAVWLAGVQTRCPPSAPSRVRVVVFAADHGVAASVFGSETVESDDAPPPAEGRSAAARQRLQALAAGRGRVDVFARAVGAGVRLADVGVDDEEPGGARPRSTGRIDEGSALSPAHVEHGVATGARIADEEIDAGADLLIAASTGSAGSDIVAAALVGVLTNTEPVKALGVTSRLDDATWMRAMAAVRDAHRHGAESRYDVPALLGRIGGADVAALTGFLLRAAARRIPVLLDGPVACAAALVARDVSPRAIRWWQAGSRSPNHAHRLALDELQLDPLLDLGLDLDLGVGALLAVPLLTAAVQAVSEPASDQS